MVQREKWKEKLGFFIMNSLEKWYNTITIWIGLIKENKDEFTLTSKKEENNFNILTKYLIIK